MFTNVGMHGRTHNVTVFQLNELIHIPRWFPINIFLHDIANPIIVNNGGMWQIWRYVEELCRYVENLTFDVLLRNCQLVMTFKLTSLRFNQVGMRCVSQGSVKHPPGEAGNSVAVLAKII